MTELKYHGDTHPRIYYPRRYHSTIRYTTYIASNLEVHVVNLLIVTRPVTGQPTMKVQHVMLSPVQESYLHASQVFHFFNISRAFRVETNPLAIIETKF